MEFSNEQIAMRVSRISIICNVLLSIFKLFAGIFAHSAAMLSDAVHSLSDVLSTLIVIAGVKMSSKTSDKEHPYGHERFECVAAIVLSAILFTTGLGIGWTGTQQVISGDYTGIATPGLLALVVATISIVVKEAMYWYTQMAAKKINSSVLMADAWHHRSDAFSAIGSFVGILGARLGFPFFDPLACLIISLFILKIAIDIFRDAVGKMTDKACDDQTIAEMHKVIHLQEEVTHIDGLKTRLFGDKIYVDVEISVDGSTALVNAHKTAHCVHDVIEAQFPKVKHCMVHVNPAIVEYPHD